MRTCIDCQFLVKTHDQKNGQAHTYNWDENEKAHRQYWKIDGSPNAIKVSGLKGWTQCWL